MTTKTKKGLLVLGIIALLIIIYRFAFPGDSEKLEDINAADDGTVDDSTLDFPLRLGRRGADVKAWQDFIFTQRYGVGTDAARKRYVDGIYGPNTEADTLKITGSKVVTLASFLNKIGAASGMAALSGAGTLESES